MWPNVYTVDAKLATVQYLGLGRLSQSYQNLFRFVLVVMKCQHKGGLETVRE